MVESYNTPIEKAISRIMKSSDIDDTILELVFSTISINGRTNNIQRGIEEVLNTVLEDFNLIKGENHTLTLAECKLISSSATTGSLYYVPAEARKNMKIREVLRVGYGTIGLGVNQYTAQYNNSIIDGITSIMESSTNGQSFGTARVTLPDTNTICISTSSILAGNIMLTVDLENIESVNKIQKANWDLFADICILYVKSYLYKKRLTIKKNAKLSLSGMASEIDSILESYSGASTEYRDAVKTNAGKMLMFADRQSHFSQLAGIVK